LKKEQQKGNEDPSKPGNRMRPAVGLWLRAERRREEKKEGCEDKRGAVRKKEVVSTLSASGVSPVVFYGGTSVGGFVFIFLCPCANLWLSSAIR